MGVSLRLFSVLTNIEQSVGGPPPGCMSIKGCKVMDRIGCGL